MRLSRLLLLTLGLALAACPDDPVTAPTDTTDTAAEVVADASPETDVTADADTDDADLADDIPDAPDDPWLGGTPALLAADGQLLLEGTFDGSAPAWFALDTGAALTTLDHSLGGDGFVVSGTVEAGPFTRRGTFQLNDLTEASAFVGSPLGALAGADLFGTVPWAMLDYATPQAFAMQALPETGPAGLAPGAPIVVPFTIAANIPVVEADLGAGAPVELIADTGSGVTIITESVWAEIQDGTLPELPGYVWKSLYGEDQAKVVRLPSLTVGEASAAQTWAVVIPDAHHLSNTLALAGLPTTGFLGYPFYRRFVVGYDANDAQYAFYPYANLDHVPADEWTRMGFEVSWRGTDGYVVEWIYEGTDAAAVDLQVGDRVVAIDGEPIDDESLAEVRALMSGTAGVARTVGWAREGGATGEVTIEVEELLPPLAL